MPNRLKKVILYAEDDPNDILLAQVAFKKSGFPGQLRIVRDGRDVIGWLSGEGLCADRTLCPLPHLIITDLNMRISSGFDVVRGVRSHPAFSTLPVIVYSTSTNPDHMDMARLLGASAYCVKKPSFAELLRTVKELLGTDWTPLIQQPASVPALRA